MGKVLLALTAALLFAAVFAGGAGGTHSNGKGPKQDIVAGTGQISEAALALAAGSQVHVNAQRDSETLEARGHFYVKHDPRGFDFAGTVTCLRVQVNQAVIVGQIDRSRGTLGPGDGFLAGNYVRIEITDGGEPGTLDAVNFSPGSEQEWPCSFPIIGFLISQGNYIVHQDPPLSLLSWLDLQIAEIEAAAGEH
jgi:hypothetical protein